MSTKQSAASASGSDPISIDFTTDDDTPFMSLLGKLGESFNTIEDLEKWIDAHKLDFDQADPIKNITNLNYIIKTGLHKKVDEIFNIIQDKLIVGSTPILDNQIIEIMYTDNLKIKKKKRTASISYVDLKSRLETLKTALKNAFEYKKLEKLNISQAEFIKAFFTNAITASNMNVESIRSLYETLSAVEQCNTSYGLKLPTDWSNGSDFTDKCPKRFQYDDDKKKDWEQHCYICGQPIADNEAQCEHILPVFEACAFNCLITSRDSHAISNVKLKKLEYAGSHPCCNRIKTNNSFIVIKPEENPPVKVNISAIKLLLTNIIYKIINDDNSSCNTGNLTPLKTWKHLNIDNQSKSINDDYLEPLVKELNNLLGSKKE
jgi:hypothetical protein